MWSEDPNWLMTGGFLLALSVMGLTMKLAVYLLPSHLKLSRSSVFWLLLSPPSYQRLKPVKDIKGFVYQFAGTLLLLFVLYGCHAQLSKMTGIPTLLLSYAAAPILLLLSESLVMLASLLWLPSGQWLPPLHHRPWLAHSISEFWGRRWNLWFSDWTRYAVFRPIKRHPIPALLLAFTISGIFHEWVINVPLYFVTGRSLFGGMMVYFLLQAIGILMERWIWKEHPVMKTVMTWIFVLAPTPLVINEGLLRTMHLWPQ